ncbi:hypothetical protein [Variovorax ginsengisoli]|uniref:Uncharacterized protein n=1 Tax=Variovorax ginsengisoli TaxID=363844 RepID=A0ABT8S5U6_9BURK|nr:hypothetical protein [Variovorax ginsengisoli]MDN8614950.1 hypothetical protein [Variovorax ginsengisoli]MDO1534120.1 hypothetical protein [Variovorax ginsengisoli]
MRLIGILAASAAVTLAGCSSIPGSSVKQAEEHETHHPAAETAPKVDPVKFDQQMKTMQEMHRKMVAAKTPAERAALMKDHMKVMQDGMAMMGQMGAGPEMMSRMDGGMSSMPGGMHKDMMQRMAMMQMMMQMMVDREAAILLRPSSSLRQSGAARWRPIPQHLPTLAMFPGPARHFRATRFRARVR